MRTIQLTIAASSKHCGVRSRDCQYSLQSGGCSLFSGYRIKNAILEIGHYFDRLPECIAAEKEVAK